MIISNSLDKILLKLCLSEYNLRTVVSTLERLSEADPAKPLAVYFLENCANATRTFKGAAMRYRLHSDVDTYTAYVLAFLGIPFVYDFMKSIYESSPEGTLTLPLLFKIFQDSFNEYSVAVGITQLAKDMPSLDNDEINFISIFIKALVDQDFGNLTRSLRNDIIN